MSRFDYSIFYGGYDNVAVSKEKYTKEQAIEIAKMELEDVREKEYTLSIGSGFVRHRAGINEDNEPCVGWWLEYTETSRSCPCWVFHKGIRHIDERDGYEHIWVAALRKEQGE